MATVYLFLKMACVLVAALLIGNWFLAEVKRAKVEGAPWYQPYLTLPGGIIVAAVILVPIVLWYLDS
jgi:hypothetical protein